MRPNAERWRKTTHLISQRNSVPHLVRNSVLRCGKPTAASTKTYQQLGRFSPNFSLHRSSKFGQDRACEAFYPRLKQREEDGKSEVWPPESETMRIKPWEHSQACLGRKVILTRTGAKSIHISLTERACKSPTLFNDVSTNKRVTLRVRIRSGADSKGSNGAPIRPSRTTDKSQEGTPMGYWSQMPDTTHKSRDHSMSPQGNLIQSGSGPTWFGWKEGAGLPWRR